MSLVIRTIWFIFLAFVSLSVCLILNRCRHTEEQLRGGGGGGEERREGREGGRGIERERER